MATFRIKNTLFIGNQNAKCKVDLPKQTIITTTLVTSPRNHFSFKSCVWRNVT